MKKILGPHTRFINTINTVHLFTCATCEFGSPHTDIRAGKMAKLECRTRGLISLCKGKEHSISVH